MFAKTAGLMTLTVACCAQSWQPVAVPTTASLRGLRAVNEKIVWASGTGGTVIRTVDGGRKWDVMSLPGAETLDFRGIWAWDADSAFVMSSGKAEDGLARIYRTANGGKDWILAFEQKTPGVFFDAIAFWDRQHGIVLSDPVDGRFLVFRTGDGGASWRQSDTPSMPGEGAFAASNSCLTLQGSSNVWFGTGGAKVARVFRSADRGVTWSVAETPIHPRNASSGIFSLAFRDQRHGLAVGGDYAHPDGPPLPNAIKTADGGMTWQTAGPAAIYLSSVVFKPGTILAVAAGTKGIESGPAWSQTSSFNINALAFPARGPGWAVGPRGAVYRESVANQGTRVRTSMKPAN